MTNRQITTAVLTETMSRLAERVHADRTRKLATLDGTVLCIAADRMLAASEGEYFAAHDAYRAIKGPHASIPAGCKLY